MPWLKMSDIRNGKSLGELKSKSWALIQIIQRREEYSSGLKMGWFERLEGQSGDIAFTPVADSEEELRELISRDNPKADLDDIRGKYRKKVSEEFIEQSPSYSDSSEDSREESDDDEDQGYHQHGLCLALVKGLLS